MSQPGVWMRPMLSTLIAAAALACIASTQAPESAEGVEPVQASATPLAVTLRLGLPRIGAKAVGTGRVTLSETAVRVMSVTPGPIATLSVPALSWLLPASQLRWAAGTPFSSATLAATAAAAWALALAP
jgi:hypothetical protein